MRASKYPSVDDQFTTRSLLSKSSSRRSHTPTPSRTSSSLTKSMSQRSTTPIMYSFSRARRKPAPIEKQLECTLEELCHGCVKKIKITRDVVSDVGLIVQEEETLKIKVKPGWKRGTKVTFEGMGDEKPGSLPADIVFLIAEKHHPLFKRVEDDLLLTIEIPLLSALTGCTLSIPLLGGAKMSLQLKDIIYPGYEKIIPGQGMPDPRDQGRRGDLRVKFHINFPTQLSNQQRSEIRDLLGDS
ncbi:PREDICTED: dnaJ homolog subfamily B member 13-like [Nelumbo nucifera]|nr:PREDICTED: dnaJ homolog subfamily B member 13-like [Nelumbo nucifera]